MRGFCSRKRVNDVILRTEYCAARHIKKLGMEKCLSHISPLNEDEVINLTFSLSTSSYSDGIFIVIHILFSPIFHNYPACYFSYACVFLSIVTMPILQQLWIFHAAFTFFIQLSFSRGNINSPATQLDTVAL